MYGPDTKVWGCMAMYMQAIRENLPFPEEIWRDPKCFGDLLTCTMNKFLPFVARLRARLPFQGGVRGKSGGRYVNSLRRTREVWYKGPGPGRDPRGIPA